MKVLHSVDTFLSQTENWIYPQIMRPPAVQSRVLCRCVVNLNDFPIDKRRLFVNSPAWSEKFGIPKVFNHVARRVGFDGLAELQARRWKPDLIHAHFGWRGVGGLKLKRRLGIPLITSFYGYDAWLLPNMESVWKDRYHELFANGDLFLVEGPAMRSRLITLGCPTEKIRVQRIGVDMSSLAFQQRHPSRSLKVVMVGRFVEKKGLEDGLRACSIARSNGVDLSVTIIGGADEHDEAGKRIESELKALARQPNLVGAVDFVGFLPLDQTRRVVQAHNVFLCPSKHSDSGDAEGGSPVILTEAMAMGLICLGTRHCDIPELIHPDQTGFLCDEGDIDGLAEALCRLGAGSDQGDISELGRRHIEESFSQAKQLRRLAEIYQSMSN